MTTYSMEDGVISRQSGEAIEVLGHIMNLHIGMRLSADQIKAKCDHQIDGDIDEWIRNNGG